MEITEKSRLPGPNRRSENSILEYQLSFRPEFAELPVADDIALLQAIRSWLQQMVGSDMAEYELEPVAGDSWPACIGRHFARLALSLQQHAGHAVGEFGVHPDSEDPVIWVWFEYDHVEVGERAAQLTMAALKGALNLRESAVDPSLAGLKSPDPQLPDHTQLREFLGFSRSLALPRETRALIAAARRRDIPCFKLDRYPYDPLHGDFRIRPNGLLRLGHARYSLVLDGTLCVNRNPAQITRLRERRGMRAALLAAGVPVETDAAGDCHRILVIGGRVVAAMRDGTSFDPEQIHLTTRLQFQAVQQRCMLPIFAAEIRTPDISVELAAVKGAWIDLDLAPQLERWFLEGGAALDHAADLLLQQHFPDGSNYRIPIVSVTGTNGKTTTCTMLRNIMQAAGRTPVVVCSNGVYLGDQLQGSRREIGRAADWYALESSAAEVAVLEDYFGSICRFGFAYEWSDVAVCTNVTVDHLHRLGVHTLEQMAEVKFAVVARARRGVVLNADDIYCAAMLTRASAAKRVAVSLTRDRSSLSAAHPGVEQFCVVEEEGGSNCIALYDGAARFPLVGVDEIPATMQGMARHNTSNAMHAAAAAWLLGVDLQDIAAALRAFTSDFVTCRGRLNEFTGLPFRVIMDYAHNADGFRQLSAFVDAQQVSGRKLIMFNYSEDRRQREIEVAVRELAGHFDLYTCGKFREARSEVSRNMPELLRQALLQCGVSAAAISVAADSVSAQNLVLDQARPGDLVVLLVGSSDFDSLWQRLESMRSAPGAQAEAFT
jgi:UDP-N-acetylmuramyl tripeptide synthase